jgi:ornithine cyclodeaminase/alanine dehydrogenase-like protein (mu-crystallin family)
MLLLNQKQIRQCLPPETAMAAVEQAFAIQESGNFTMPDRLAMQCGDEGNQLLLMPCRSESALTTKLITVFPGNPNHGRPMIQGVVMLCDPNTGDVLALLDAKSLTALRTGAVTGVSVRHLAPSGAHTLGLVGCGVQGYEQIRHSCAAADLKRVLLLDRSSAAIAAMTERINQSLPSLKVTAASSTEEFMRECQIVITATTARTPVLPNNPDLYANKHCVAIGSFEADVREYPDAIFQRTAKVWIDTPHALVESGELAIPLATNQIHPSQIQTLGDLIASGQPADRGEHNCTFFKSVGMGLLDMQAARAVYEQARAAGIGTNADFD